MTFRIFNVNVEISVPFTVILAFLLINDKTGLMSASLVAVLLHEIGHLAVMVLYRCQPQSIKLSSAGILICGSAFCTSCENILISLSGPVSNLLFTLIFYLFSKIFCSTLFLYFAAVQFIVGIVNLLPIKGLDGGAILYAVLSKFSRINADLICNLVSIFLAFFVLAAGVGLAIKNVSNPTLLLLGIYLIVLNLMKR